MSTESPTVDRIIRLVEQTADQIHDPCALGSGMQIGMSSMGLIRSVEAAPSDAGWNVAVALRFTGPECMNYFYFKQNVEQLVAALDEVATVEVTFDAVFDWEESMMSDEAQRLFHQRTQQMRRLAEQTTPVAITAGVS